MIMKAIIKTHLNKRTQRPSINAPNPGYYSPGNIVDIIDIVNGDSYEGNNVWYKLNTGAYIWSGGIEGITSLKDISESVMPTVVNYNQLITNIPPAWTNTQGHGIKIAILDTGIHKGHPDLHIPGSNLFDTCNSSFGYEDKDGHGTHVAGLIGANTMSADTGIIGVAPKAELIIIKVRHEEKKFNQKNIAQAIEKALEMGANIINMSFKLSYYDSAELKNAIKKATQNKCIMIAAAGDDDYLIYNQFNMPAFFPEIIAVGAADIDFHKTNKAQYNPKLDFILPKRKLLSASIAEKNNYEKLEGSSMATGLVSGIAALCLSHSGKQNLITKNELVDLLKSKSEKMTNYTSEEQLKLYAL